MSEVIDITATLRNAKPVPDALQGQLDLALRLALSVMMPPKIKGARLADERDIDIRKTRIAMVAEAYGDFVHATMNELNESLRLDNTIDTTDFFRALADLQSDLNWLLDRAANNVNE
jgi:hypothetical protein